MHYLPQLAVSVSANEATSPATKLYKHSCPSRASEVARKPHGGGRTKSLLLPLPFYVKPS